VPSWNARSVPEPFAATSASDLLGLVNALARVGGGHDGTSADGNRLLMLALTGIMTVQVSD
jgi:hypothetical protein